MSKKYTLDGNDASGTANDAITSSNVVASPVYASTLAAANSYRTYQWYLDGTLTAGGNAFGANVDKISTE